MKIVNTTTLILLSLSLVGTGCGKKTENETDQAYLVAESAVSSVNGALNDSEQSNGYAFKQPSFSLISSAYATSCGLSRFSPSVGGNCNATAGTRTVVSNFTGCTAGRRDEFELNGQVTLTFDSNATCNSWIGGGSLPTSGSVNRTTSNFSRSNPNGSFVSVSSANHTNYSGATLGGGVTTTFGVGSRTLSIAGIHRVRTTAAGKTVYDHSVSTLSPIVATGTRLGGNRQITSGMVRVDHNLAKFSSTASLAGLNWNLSCCHPISGTVTFNLNGSETSTLVVDFATGSCGEAHLSKNGSSLGTLELSACE